MLRHTDRLFRTINAKQAVLCCMEILAAEEAVTILSYKSHKPVICNGYTGEEEKERRYYEYKAKKNCSSIWRSFQ